jgi:hypothetical protein
MRRRLAILLLGLLGSLCASTFLSPSTASAIGLDCKESPTPEVPGRGLTGFFQSEPKPLPATGDPFAPNAKTTIYEQYGYAGLRWTTYDLGCGPDSARAPDATAGTAVANWLFLVPKAGVAFTNAVVEVAFRPTFLGELGSDRTCCDGCFADLASAPLRPGDKHCCSVLGILYSRDRNGIVSMASPGRSSGRFLHYSHSDCCEPRISRRNGQFTDVRKDGGIKHA